jgi:MFS family permease
VKLSYRWLLVAIGALMGCVAIGAMFSLAVYLQPMAADTGWSRAGISSAMTLDFLAMGLAGFAWGAASDRYGARPVVLAGAALLGLGQLLAARAQTLLEFQLAWGVVMGVAGGAFFTPLMAAVTTWFEDHRSLAVSLVSAGVGVAPMTMSPLARWLVSTYDWRMAMAVLGLGSSLLVLPAALLLRRPALAAAVPSGPVATPQGQGASAAQAFLSLPFIVLAVTFFFCCAAHSGPIFHTMSYAIYCGVTPMVAVSVYSMEGLAGLGGRVLLGVLADRYGVKPVLVTGLLVQAVAVGAYVFVSRLVGFYSLAVVLGAAYGGVMPLYAVLAREYFGARIIGTVLGAAVMSSSLGMALGPLAGGWVFDHLHSYRWLYLGSCAAGLCAAGMASFFPPLPLRPRESLQLA